MDSMYIRKIIKEELEKALREKPNLLGKLKKRLRSMNGSDDSGYGSWKEKGSTWSYDDAEGGYYHTAYVNFSDPAKVQLAGSDHQSKEREKFLPLSKESDIDRIITFIEKTSGLKEGSDGEED